MILHLSLADCTGNKANVLYPNGVEISSVDQLLEAVKKDHVCGKFTDDKRSNANFIESDVIVMDCDNDHSENPDEWITTSDVEEMFADVDFAIVPSRHHMLQKDGKAARPRFHIYFAIPKCTDADEYAAIKARIHKQFTFFDDNALDAARFIFGADPGDAIWNDGWCNILDILNVDDGDDSDEDFDSTETISEGCRNNTMSRYAGKIVMRFGASEKAHELFMKRAAKCDPPLSDEELSTIWNSACKFAKKVQAQGGYIPPDQYDADFDNEPGSLKPDDYSDIGQARALLRVYGDDLRFTTATDYLRYDGKVWNENKQLAVGAMEEFLDLQLQDAMDYLDAAKKALIKAGIDESTVNEGGKELEKAIDDKSRIAYLMYLGAQTYLKFVQKHRDYKYITSGLQAAKPMVCIAVTDLDKNENFINTPDATYDLTKGMAGAMPHNPMDLITKITNVSPGDKGAQIWQEALETFFCNDHELMAYVQEIVGMAAVGKVNAEQMIIAYGGGANGKSTFWNCIARVLGTYSGKLSAEALTLNCKRNVKPEMAELKGKRLIIASELEEGVRLNTAVVKQLCSTDPIYAEKKYKDPFMFDPSHLLVLYTNHLPKISSSNDEGIWRRLIVIPFNAHIVGSSDIKNYADYLFENAGPAVMKWIIEGALVAISHGFHATEPQCVKDAVEKYRQDNDWLGQFINDCCEVDPSYSEKSGELYQQYRAYCITNGEYTRSTTDFYNCMDKAGFIRRKTNAGIIVQGIQLKSGNDFLD